MKIEKIIGDREKDGSEVVYPTIKTPFTLSSEEVGKVRKVEGYIPETGLLLEDLKDGFRFSITSDGRVFIFSEGDEKRVSEILKEEYGV